MAKRLAVILLSGVLMLVITGCTSASNPQGDGSVNEEQLPLAQAPLAQNPVEHSSDDSEGLTSQKAVRFIVMADSRGSDNGVNTKIVKKILQEIKQLSPQPEFAIMPGDLTDGSKNYSGIIGQLSYFKKVVTEFYPEKFFYPGIGNHEMTAGKNGEKAFSSTFNGFNASFLEGYNRTSYYFDVGDTRLFMLNSDHPGEMHRIIGKQLEWVKSDIDPSKKHNIFLLHEPPYPAGAEEGNSLDKYPSLRDAFWKLVDHSNHPIVFCGHEHNYSRRLVDKSFHEKVGGVDYKFDKQVFQVITGGFGAPLYTQYSNKKSMVVPPIPEYHFTIVDIDDSAVKIQAVNIDGKIIDSFQIE